MGKEKSFSDIPISLPYQPLWFSVRQIIIFSFFRLTHNQYKINGTQFNDFSVVIEMLLLNGDLRTEPEKCFSHGQEKHRLLFGETFLSVFFVKTLKFFNTINKTPHDDYFRSFKP